MRAPRSTAVHCGKITISPSVSTARTGRSLKSASASVYTCSAVTRAMCLPFGRALGLFPGAVVWGSTVLFGWCGRWGRTGSTSDASWLGGRDDHLPAGSPALTARQVGRGGLLHIRDVRVLDTPQGLECGPDLPAELGGGGRVPF